MAVPFFFLFFEIKNLKRHESVFEQCDFGKLGDYCPHKNVTVWPNTVVEL